MTSIVAPHRLTASVVALGLALTLLSPPAFASPGTGQPEASSPVAFQAAATPLVSPVGVFVGPLEQVVPYAVRNSLGLTYWPDGLLGLLPTGQGNYLFFGANSSAVARTTGTLNVPYSGGVRSNIQIQNLKHVFQYIAGGPVYRDSSSGMLLMMYHAERWPNGDSTRFYSTLGIAKSTDLGLTWSDVGEIISPNVPFGGTTAHVEMAGGPYAIVNGYFQVYFRDRDTAGNIQQLAVARASVSSVVNAARQNTVVAWTKYYNGTWSQPGLGGKSSPLESSNGPIRWFDVSYNTALGQYLIVTAVPETDGTTSLHMLQSTDSVAWSGRQRLTFDPGESFYPTLVGTGSNPRSTDNAFYVYQTYSLSGNRWTDASLDRRAIYVNDNH